MTSKPPKKPEPLRRYAAKMLWQFRVSKGVQSKRKRLCEERIVMFKARGREDAYRKAVRYGKQDQTWWWLDEAKDVKCTVEFIGVLELDELWSYIEKEEFHETWYELKDLWMPMERKEKLVPPKKALREFDDLLTERSRGKGVVKLKW
jgi:hypothetical protein